MDDYDAKAFYKAEIGKLIDTTEDVDTLDLIYKIIVEIAKK